MSTTKPQASNLYQRAIIDHNRSPYGYGDCKGATHRASGRNPICGDLIEFSACVVDGKFQTVNFTAKSCALCKASASLLCKTTEKASLDQFSVWLADFTQFLQDGERRSLPEELSAFGDIHAFPARAKCVLLPWRTLHGAISNQASVTAEG